MVKYVEDASTEGKIEKKSKKKKNREEAASNEISRSSRNVLSTMEDDETSKKGKRKKHNKDENNDGAICVTQKNDGAISNHQKANVKRKKRRKLDPSADDDKKIDDVNVLGFDSDVKTEKEEKRKKKKKKNKQKDGKDVHVVEVKDMENCEKVHKKKCSGENVLAEKHMEVCEYEGKKKTAVANDVGEAAGANCGVAEKVEKRKRKKHNKEGKDIFGVDETQEILAEDLCHDSSVKHDVDTRKGEKPKSAAAKSDDLKAKKKLKNVTFSDKVEVFPASDGTSKPNEKKEGDGVVRGKWFTPEEDEIIKKAVLNYIAVHGLGEEGLEMVLHCRSYPKLRNCWKDIGAALPSRPYRSVYVRAHNLFERGPDRPWSTEEFELIKKYHDEHGPNWAPLAAALGKHNTHLYSAWCRIKLPNRKRGNWSQEEYEKLFNLVNTDLKMKVAEEKKSRYGMLRDNIGWSAISDSLGTRTITGCCAKWYRQLTSPMVKEGIWADIDDYRMLQKLYELDACCKEDVDWDNLLDHRPGDACQRRWDQMYNHIGEHGCKTFAGQVEVLWKRYGPEEVLEAREIWDNKPFIS